MLLMKLSQESAGGVCSQRVHLKLQNVWYSGTKCLTDAGGVHHFRLHLNARVHLVWLCVTGIVCLCVCVCVCALAAVSVASFHLLAKWSIKPIDGRNRKITGGPSGYLQTKTLSKILRWYNITSICSLWRNCVVVCCNIAHCWFFTVHQHYWCLQ